MKKVKGFIFGLIFLSIIVGSVLICVKYYSYIFAREVYGQIFQIERVTNPSLVLGGSGMSKSPEVMYSFAVAVRTADGEIVTASSEDRQWAVAKKGLCAEAKFYPYAPWNLAKSGTYFNARLVKLKDCEQEFNNLTKLGDEPQETPAAASEADQVDGQQQQSKVTNEPSKFDKMIDKVKEKVSGSSEPEVKVEPQNSSKETEVKQPEETKI